MYFYREFRWTRDVVDDMELEYLCDIMIVADKCEHAKEITPIDEVF